MDLGMDLDQEMVMNLGMDLDSGPLLLDLAMELGLVKILEMDLVMDLVMGLDS
jgi:hypothetical protein